MNAYFVDKKSSFSSEDRIDSYHYTMFHGIGRRKNKNDINFSSIEHPAKSLLVLILNNYRYNPIIQPGLNLIVTQDIGNILLNHADIRLLNVDIEAVATIEYFEGIMKHWENPKYEDTGGTPERILVKNAKRGKEKWKGPKMMEVVPHDGEEMKILHEEDVFCISGKLSVNTDLLQIKLSKKALQQYGILWFDGIHCIREDIFFRIQDAFHKEYFLTKLISI